MIGNLLCLLAGLLFAAGLAIGGMTDARNVVGFLDVTGHWQPGLALVMVGAISVYAVALALARRRSRPLLANTFSAPLDGTSGRPPGKAGIDAQLIVGAALFGLGWGWAGYCPGPALSSLGTGDLSAALFVVAMLAGTWVAQRRPLRSSALRPCCSSQSAMAARN